MRTSDEITHNGQTLAEIIKLHHQWLYDEEGGERADLSGADLSSAYLSSADLSSADLSSANLSSADLSSADLSSANLSSANLRGAYLRGANLRSANLSSAYLDIPYTPDPELIKKVAAAALDGANGKTPHLNMEQWHTCDTTHCIAGWAITLHPEGKLLESFTSPYLAGRLLLGDEAASHFFDDNASAREYLEQFLPK